MTNKSLYIKICEQTKGIPLFMQPWWMDVVCPDWDVTIAKKGDQVTGIWAYPVENKMGVSMLRTPMLTPYLGPHVLYPHDVKESNIDSFEHETIAGLLKQLPETKVWHLSIQPGIKQVGLFKQYKLRTQVQQTFLLELAENEETLFANMKEATRRNIRQAEKEVTIAESTDYLKDIYEFQQHTLTKKGKQCNYSLVDLKTIMAACKAHNAGTLWVAKNAEQVQAIVWQVWDDKCSYYFMGGQNPGAKSYKAMSLLLWHAIKESKKRGNTTFDLEGSMDEGVERFFRNFGGQRALYLVLHKNDSLLWRLKKMILG
jgi:lipid II:glycine glycyltransferase (peptidoglycan interpeptide bridge formation enzyme)